MITSVKKDSQIREEPRFCVKIIRYSNNIEENEFHVDWMDWIDSVCIVVNESLYYQEFIDLKKTEIPFYEYNKILAKVKKNVEKGNY